MPSVRSTFLTTDPEDALDAKFGASLVARAKKRTVEPAGDNQWIVLGEGRMGDAYDSYRVRFDGRLYHCSCRDHVGGEFRKMCSHALAAMILRKGRVGGQATPVKPVEVGKLPDAIPALTDPMWGTPGIPSKFSELRPHQWEAIQQIVEAFRESDIVFLDAPTGSGKTLIGECVRRLMQAKAIYICSTKTLQDQFLNDFDYARVLKGRSNYPTYDRPDDFDNKFGAITAADCIKSRTDLECENCPANFEAEVSHCAWCHPVAACPYEQAKNKALVADVAVLNTSYFLTECNAVGMFSARGQEKRTEFFELVIVDEADLLEQELMGRVQVHITKKQMKDYKLDMPDFKTKQDSWLEWAVKTAIALDGVVKKFAGKTDLETVKKRKRADRVLGDVRMLAQNLKRDAAEGVEGSWVFDGYDKDEIIFRPVRVNEYGPRMLWPHGKKWLLMSATLISPEQMAEDLGVAEWKKVEA